MVGKSPESVQPVTVARPAASTARAMLQSAVAPAEEGGVVEGAAGGVKPYYKGVYVAVEAGSKAPGVVGKLLDQVWPVTWRGRRRPAPGHCPVAPAPAEEGTVDQVRGVVVRRDRLPGRIDGRAHVQGHGFALRRDPLAW